MKLEKVVSIFQKIINICVSFIFIGIAISAFIITGYFVNTSYSDYNETIKYSVDNIAVNIIGILLFIIIIYCVLGKVLKNKTIYFIAFIHFLIGIFWALYAKSPLRADQYMVASYAKQFLEGNFQSLDAGGYLFHHPLQLSIVYYIKLIYKIFGTENTVALWILNSLYTMITFIYLYKIGVLIFDKEKIELNLKILISTFFILDILSIYIYGNVIGLALSMIALYNLFKFYKDEKIQNIIVLIFSMLFAIVIKSNYMIYFIGIIISLVFFIIQKKRLKMTVICIIAIVLIFSGYKFANKIIVDITEEKYGQEISEGNPMISYIQMGMAEKVDRASGWYNANVNVEKSFTENNYDVEETKESSKQFIKERVIYFIKNPKSFLKYYVDKILSTWTEPAFQTIWTAEPQDYITEEIRQNIEEHKLLKSFYDGELNKIFIRFCDIYEITIFVTASAYIIKNLKKITLEQFTILLIFLGGFVFHILWETKCIYVIPYYILVLPYSACGLEIIKEDTIKIYNNKLKKIINLEELKWRK